MKPALVAIIPALALMVACGSTEGPAEPPGIAASAAVSQSTTTEFVQNGPVFMPCANGGLGEDMIFEGTAITHLHVTESAGNTITTRIRIDGAADWKAIGLTTGDVYYTATRGPDGIARGVFNLVQVLNKGGGQATIAQVEDYVNPANGAEIRTRRTFHITINANGEVTVFFDEPFC